MCSSRLFSLNCWSSTVLQRRLFKKERAVHLLNSAVRSGSGKRARLKNRGDNCEEEEEDMKMVNRKLYLKNKCIMEENKRLREIALFLSQENQALQSHVQNIKKSSMCTTLQG